MAEINLAPSLNMSPTEGLSAIRVQPVVQPTGANIPTDYQTFHEPFMRANEERARIAENNQRRIQAEQKARQLKADEKFNTLPAIDQEAIIGYQKQYGAVPRDAMGNFDLAKVRQYTEEDAQMRRANFRVAAAMAGLKYHEGTKLNEATGQMEEVGQWVDPVSGEIVREQFYGTTPGGTAAGGRGGYTALQRQEEAAAIQASTEVHKSVKRAQEIVRRVNAVGPVVGSGAGKAWGWLKAALGSEEQRNAQRTLTMLISAQTMENANKLKGPLTEKELGFLRNSIPSESDTEAVWELWLNDLDKYFQRAIAERTAALNGQPLSKSELDAKIPPGRGAEAAPAAPSTLGTMPVGRTPSMDSLRGLPISSVQSATPGRTSM